MFISKLQSMWLLSLQTIINFKLIIVTFIVIMFFLYIGVLLYTRLYYKYVYVIIIVKAYI